MRRMIGDSAISILHSMRKKHEYNMKVTRLIAGIITLLMAFDMIIIILFKIEQMGLIAWGGLAGLILGLGFCMKHLLLEQEAINKIDSFYLAANLDNGNKR